MKAEEMKEIRNELGISQEKLAQILDVSFATINRLENGKAEITFQLEKQLSGLKELLKQFPDRQKLIKNLSESGLAGLLGAAAISGIIKSPFAESLKELFCDAEEVAKQLKVKNESLIELIKKANLKTRKVNNKHFISATDTLTLSENVDDTYYETISDFRDSFTSFLSSVVESDTTLQAIIYNENLNPIFFECLKIKIKFEIYGSMDEYDELFLESLEEIKENGIKFISEINDSPDAVKEIENDRIIKPLFVKCSNLKTKFEIYSVKNDLELTEEEKERQAKQRQKESEEIRKRLQKCMKTPKKK